MDFVSERDVMNKLSEAICCAAVNMFYTTKYIYSVARKGFYTKEASAAIVESLKDVTNAGASRSCGIKIEPKIWDELDNPGFEALPSVIAYSFAVRVPVLQKVSVTHRKPMDKKQLERLYENCFFKGAQSCTDVLETYEENLRLIKKKKELAPYNSQWLCTYLARICPGFDTLTNQNLFIFGALSVYLPLFWDKLEERLCEIVLDNAIN